jgi:hypothetical protein
MTGFGELLAWTGLTAPVDPAADPPAAAEEPPRVEAPRPFVPTPPPFVPTPPPFVPTPLPFPSRQAQVPVLAAPEPIAAPPPAPPPAPPQRFVPPPWPFDPPTEPGAPPSRPGAPSPPAGAAAQPFIPTPLPFAPTRYTYSPEPEPLIVVPQPATTRPRFGPMHAEATARAARFVATHHAAAPARRVASPNGASPGSNGLTNLSPKGAAVMKAAAAYGVAPLPSPSAGTVTAFDRRQEAIERAIARGRSLAGEADPQPAREQSNIGSEQLGIGIALVCILLIEVFGGAVWFALGGGYVVLAFGLALDACARMLGTVAATRAGREWGTGWRWACALLGSPAVAAFAFAGDGTLVDTDLAPLAGPISALAIICLVIGLAGIPAGF